MHLRKRLMTDSSLNENDYAALRARYRQHLAASRAIIDAHAEAALAAAGGNTRRAAKILGDRAAADPALAGELHALEQLNVRLGLT
jgi:hypothetical protein